MNLNKVFSTMEEASWHVFQILTKRSERLVELANSIAWPNNVWMGVSIESAKHVERADHLKLVSSSVRFISFEPLLGPMGEIDLSGIHWVIVGGESGPAARPVETDWVRDICRQCDEYRVPFFFKQWGGIQKSKNGRMLDGQTWDAMPERFQCELESA